MICGISIGVLTAFELKHFFVGCLFAFALGTLGSMVLVATEGRHVPRKTCHGYGLEGCLFVMYSQSLRETLEGSVCVKTYRVGYQHIPTTTMV